jgi:LytS/YehU family sensor histidine kinase
VIKRANTNLGDVMERINFQKTGTRSNIILLTVGWISALLSLVIYPFIFGVVGVITGILATKNGSKAGLPLIVSSIILMGIGLIFSGVIMNYARRYLGI